MLHITTLIDTTQNQQKSLLTQHGLSFLIEYDDTRILFDAGSNGDFIRNAENMNVDLKNLSAVVLSHGHYDHAAGYKDLMKAGLAPKYLFVGDGFFENKYTKKGIRYVNMSSTLSEDEIRKHGIEIRTLSGNLQYSRGIYLVTGFKLSNPYERISSDLIILKENGFERDEFRDEVCIVLDTSKGLVIMTGSSHVGLCNVLDKVYKVFSKPIYAIIGGFPVDPKDEMRAKYTMSTLNEYNVKYIGYCPFRPMSSDTFKFSAIDINTVSVGDEFFLM